LKEVEMENRFPQLALGRPVTPDLSYRLKTQAVAKENL
jgi:hypothetical protein